MPKHVFQLVLLLSLHDLCKQVLVCLSVCLLVWPAHGRGLRRELELLCNCSLFCELKSRVIYAKAETLEKCVPGVAQCAVCVARPQSESKSIVTA